MVFPYNRQSGGISFVLLGKATKILESKLQSIITNEYQKLIDKKAALKLPFLIKKCKPRIIIY